MSRLDVFEIARRSTLRQQRQSFVDEELKLADAKVPRSELEQRWAVLYPADAVELRRLEQGGRGQ